MLSAILLAGGFSALGGQGARIVGLFFVLAIGLPLLAAGIRSVGPRLSPRIRFFVGPLILVLVVLALYRRLLIGDMPVNHDHPVILLRAYTLWHELLPNGLLSTFSRLQFAGQPADGIYPIGADLLVCLVRAVTLGLADFELAYCYALLLSILAYPLALYALGHRLGGPLAGLLAGLLGIVDRGAWNQAGWDFTLNWGVWAMGLAHSLCLWSFWAFERLARGAGSRFVWLGAAAALGGALLSHPMAVTLLGIGLPLLLGSMALAGELGAPRVWLPRVVTAAGLGFALAAVWLLPFTAHQDWFEPLASSYRPFRDVIASLFDGRLLNGLAPALAIAGLLGLVSAAGKRRPLGPFLLALSGFLLFASSDDFLVAFGMLDVLPSIGHLQFERLTYPARAALLLGAGLLFADMLRLTLEPAPEERPGWLPVRQVALSLVLAPFIALSGSLTQSPWFAPVPPLEWSSKNPAYADLQAAAGYLRALPRSDVGRIALWASVHDHSLISLPVYTDLSIFKIGFTPENNYGLKFSSEQPEVLAALGATHALSVGPRAAPFLELERRFGRLCLYRLRLEQPGRTRLEGPGQALVERDEPEAIDIRLSGTTPESRLTVFTGRYALWQATLDGQPVDIEGQAVGDSTKVFMGFAARDGLLRLRYTPGPIEWLGFAATLLGLLTAIGVAGAPLLGRLTKWKERIPARWLALARDGLTLGTLAFCLLVALGLAARFLWPRSPFPDRKVVADLKHALPEARAAVVRPDRTEPCSAWNGRRLACPGQEWSFVGRMVLPADHMLRDCVWLHPIDGARLAVTFDDVPLGDHLQGFMGLDDRVVDQPGLPSVNLSVQIDGVESGRFTCPSARGWIPWEISTRDRRGSRAQVTIQSDAAFTGRRHFCFTAYTTER